MLTDSLGQPVLDQARAAGTKGERSWQPTTRKSFNGSMRHSPKQLGEGFVVLHGRLHLDDGGDTTVRGKDPIRKWMASMDPQPPQFTILQTVAEGDSVVTRGDMVMHEKKNGPSIPYTFCDIYRFAGDKVAELTAFVIRTDKARTGDRTPNEAKQVANVR